MHRSRALVGMIAAALAVAACGGSGGHSGASAPGSPRGRVAPVHVTLALTGEHAASARVDQRGATMTATGSDGTRFSLVVPKGALISPVAIRMTPVHSVTGLPAGTDLAFAVDLQPHGLVFSRASWLTVRPAAATDVKAGLAVDDTNVASLQPIGHGAQGYVLPVAHFSGTGGVQLPGGFGQWRNLMPSGAGSASLQDHAIGAGGPVALPSDFTPPTDSGPADSGPAHSGNASLPGGAGDGVGSDATGGANTAPASSTSASEGSGGDPTLEQDIADWAQAEAQREMTGDGAPDDATRAALVQRVVNVIDDLAKRCVAGDPHVIVDIMRWEQRGMLLGMDDDEAQSARQDQIMKACMRFELAVTGTFMMDLPPVFHIGDALAATVPLEFDGAGHTGAATAPIKPTGYDRGGELIDVLGQGLGMAVGVNVPNNLGRNDYVHCSIQPGSIRVEATVSDMYRDPAPTANVTFDTTKQTAVTCDAGVGTFQVPPFVTMPEGWHEFGFHEATGSGFLMHPMTRTGGSKPYATHEMHGSESMDGAKITEDWTFRINFAPGKLPPPLPPKP